MERGRLDARLKALEAGEPDGGGCILLGGEGGPGMQGGARARPGGCVFPFSLLRRREQRLDDGRAGAGEGHAVVGRGCWWWWWWPPPAGGTNGVFRPPSDGRQRACSSIPSYVSLCSGLGYGAHIVYDVMSFAMFKKKKSSLAACSSLQLARSSTVGPPRCSGRTQESSGNIQCLCPKWSIDEGGRGVRAQHGEGRKQRGTSNGGMGRDGRWKGSGHRSDPVLPRRRRAPSRVHRVDLAVLISCKARDEGGPWIVGS